MASDRSFAFQSMGSQDIHPVQLTDPGIWRLRVEKDTGLLTADITLSDSQNHQITCEEYPTGFEFGFREFATKQRGVQADLKIVASPSTRWKATLSLISEAHVGNLDLAMSSQPPAYVCVNITSAVNVRSGPGHNDSEFPKVTGGDRDKGGGAIPGTRYKVVRSVSDGEYAAGNPIWYEIEFRGGTGWVADHYVDPC